MTLRPAALRTVVIADDNEDLAQLLGRMAEKAGWQVHLCSTGQSLCDIAADLEGPALLIVDVNMPDGNGIDAIEQIAQMPHCQRFRVRFVTGGPDVSAVAARMIANARDMRCGVNLYKPLSMEAFGRVLAAEEKELSELA